MISSNFHSIHLIFILGTSSILCCIGIGSCNWNGRPIQQRNWHNRGNHYNNWNRKGSGEHTHLHWNNNHPTNWKNGNNHKNDWNWNGGIRGNHRKPFIQINEESPQSKIGCPYPQITDRTKFLVDGCTKNEHGFGENIQLEHHCHTKIAPFLKRGIMGCIKGRRLVRLIAKCMENGEWTPKLPTNCQSLFNLVEKQKENNEEPSNPKNCLQLQINTSSNFLITCKKDEKEYFPNSINCLNEFKDGIPSGFHILITCRPPFRSEDIDRNILHCQQGKWIGKIKKMTCVYSNDFDDSIGNIDSTTISPTVKPNTHVPTTISTDHTNSPTNLYSPSEFTTTVAPSITNPKSCPPLRPRSNGVEISCTWSTTTQVITSNCNMELPIGTEARYSCKTYYETTSTLPITYRKCKDDGTWSGTSDFNCVVECGRENIVKVAYITHSSPTRRGQWPWHAGIFRRNSQSTSNWEYICGGTLLTKRALITAAHCVTLLQTREQLENSQLKIHFGKYKREDNDENVQIKDVKKIIVNPNYNPYNYDSDLALIIFNTEVVIGYFVRPICFTATTDTALEELQLAESSIGTVVGWGYNENNQLADDLRMATLRVVGNRECSKNMLGSSITQLNARSTIYCAGQENGTNVCNGDSGSGMYFPTKETDNVRWYIQGLVSVGITNDDGRCKPEKFSVFTRVGRYADFISRTLSENDAL